MKLHSYIFHNDFYIKVVELILTLFDQFEVRKLSKIIENLKPIFKTTNNLNSNRDGW